MNDQRHQAYCKIHRAETDHCMLQIGATCLECLWSYFTMHERFASFEREKGHAHILARSNS